MKMQKKNEKQSEATTTNKKNHIKTKQKRNEAVNINLVFCEGEQSAYNKTM